MDNVNQALPHHPLTELQQHLLHVLQQAGHHQLSVGELCSQAGVLRSDWHQAIKDPLFADTLNRLDISVQPPRRNSPAHIDVQTVFNPEEVFVKDVWDLRCLKPDYPKHVAPSGYELDFTWIMNLALRQQVKHYFRQHLSRWKPRTLKYYLTQIEPFLTLLPCELDIGMLTRAHVEAILPKLTKQSNYQMSRCLEATRSMLYYMAVSPIWTDMRPLRDLIWPDDIPTRPKALPRPIPPHVLDQLDSLLEKAVEAVEHNQAPSFLSPMFWDAILILRHTGMRFEDLAHLKTPDEHGHKGCLDQDSEGYWWIRIDGKMTKMGRDHRIPTRMNEGVIAAIHRQQERAKNIPDHFGEQYLFRTAEGVLAYGHFTRALRYLSPNLLYESTPYVITPHQFRHSLATDMIEQGVDIYTVKEFLGHASLSMTECYVKVYLKSLKAKYDTYRVKKQQPSANAMMSQVQVARPKDTGDGGWVENNVGKLYVSPLPDGIGNCVHLPMHDGCPDSPHCPTCPKLRANKRHLPVWENKATNLLITVEALRANPAYARARQKHEQELAHAEKVIKTIKEEGFWDGRLHNSKTHEK